LTALTYQNVAGDNPITQTLTDKAKRVIDCLEGNMNRNELVRYGENLVAAVEQLWRGVREGHCRVESIALLRVLRQTTCKEILSLHELTKKPPQKLASQLKLFVNTVRYVLKPKPLPA